MIKTDNEQPFEPKIIGSSMVRFEQPVSVEGGLGEILVEWYRATSSIVVARLTLKNRFDKVVTMTLHAAPEPEIIQDLTEYKHL